MSAGLSSRLNVLPESTAPTLDPAEEYKPSFYNHFVRDNGYVWGTNFRSAAIVRFRSDVFDKVERLLDDASLADDVPEMHSLRDSLIKAKFLVPNKLNERALLKLRNRTARFGNKGIALVIAPTLRCNFGCDYCYVDLNANKMRPDDRVKLGKFFDRKLTENTAAEIVWTGGDPSLAMDVVEDVSRRFLEVCERKNCEYRANLITNAYLLDDKMLEALQRSQINGVQVSLDGTREFHDQTRHLPNGTPTYERVLENVARVCRDIRIFLRVNVTRDNAPAMPDLIGELEDRGLAGQIFLYFAHVDDVNENSAGYNSHCLTRAEFARVQTELNRIAMGRGFTLGGRVFTEPVTTFCGANSSNYYVVDSKVNLLKCYHDLGAADKHGIGRIGDDGEEIVSNPYNLMKWMSWDPFEIEECSNCKVLPLCMGGCSHKIMSSNMRVEAGCLVLRFSTDEIVRMVGEAKLKGSAAEGGCSSCAAASASPL